MKRTLALIALFVSLFITAQAQYNNDYIKIGQAAPELSYQDPNGKVLKLSELNKGSYVLLDFWASWCGPCRASNPALVKMYNEFSTKKFKSAKNGFKVVSVSLDKNKDAWMAAIKKDNLTWPYHMSDLGGWQSEAASKYGVQYIPQAFLLDPNGKVIGKYNTSEEAKADLMKYLAK